MRGLAVIALALATCVSWAQDEPKDMIYANGRVQIRLLQGDCDNAPLALSLIAGGAFTPPRVAIVTIATSEIRACWALDADLDVLVVDEGGARAYFPMSNFSPAPAARARWVNRGQSRAAA